MAAHRSGGHRLPVLHLPGGVQPHRAVPGAAAVHRAAGLAGAAGRRNDPGADERPELCGAVRRHRRRDAPVPQEIQDRHRAPLPRHRRPVQYRHGGGRAWHLHHAADAAAGLQSRRQGVPHRAGGVPRGGLGRAATGLHGSRRGADHYILLAVFLELYNTVQVWINQI